MSYFKVNYKKSEFKNGKNITPYETDTNLNVQVFTSDSGSGYQIYSGVDLVAEIELGEFLLEGNKFTSLKSSYGWVSTDDPKFILEALEGNSYFINNEKVCTIDYGDGVFNWLIEIVKNRRFESYKPSIEIRFNAGKVEPLIALCILFAEIRADNSGD
ncbi:hypothetical protein [Catenovulum sediminis]|uniref:hypothetical protein n=1 Tax=Catenovulum sediminis TaxID=1740262 RepID=UPI00117F5B20|nr:hypothetical protein [Catenovulum sediminis]